MGRISDEDIQKVREATDIVALLSECTRVQQRGREFWCCCPLHNEKTPSFKIDPSTQLWHCFGCGEGGDIFAFVMKTDEITFPEAVRKLAERAHIQIAEDDRSGVTHSQKQRLRDVCKAAEQFFHTQLMRSLSDNAAQARSYLSSRGLGGSVPNSWNLGFAPGRGMLSNHLRSLGFTAEEMVLANVSVNRNGRLQDRFYERIMFPIHDVSGECVAFGGRIVGSGEPKYLNSQETPLFHKSQVLFGLDKAKAKMTSTGCAIIAEGYTDVIAMHEAGISNCVATLGTALTKNHLRLLSRHAGKRIVYLFDGDAAGQRATERALQFIDDASTPEIGRAQIEICALSLPDGQDPAEFLSSHSAEELQALIDGAEPLLRFGIERKLARHDIGTAEGRAKALPDVLSVLAPIKDSILAKEYAVELAQRLRLREDDVLLQLAQLQKPTQNGNQDAIAPSSATTSNEEVQLSSHDSKRFSLEQELLCAVIQQPLSALTYIDTLADRSWLFADHKRAAHIVLQELTNNLSASPADLVKALAAEDAHLASSMTSSLASYESNTQELFAYLINELTICDLEDKVVSLKSQLAKPSTESSEEDRLFKELIQVQEALLSAQKLRKPLV